MTTLDRDYRRFKAEGTELAGALGDFQQRAGAYYEIFRHSDGNFAFPLIAAHGALWGAGHMRRGTALCQWLARLECASPTRRDAKMDQVRSFTDTLKDINRQVLVMTYKAYQMTREHARDPNLKAYIPDDLVIPLAACHAARREGWQLNAEAKRKLFEAAFRWEQRDVVGPAIERALPCFEWSLARKLSMRPPIGFSYFGPFEWLWFRNFANRDERIAQGLRAYDIASRKGFSHVEACLQRYDASQNSLCRFARPTACLI